MLKREILTKKISFVVLMLALFAILPGCAATNAQAMQPTTEAVVETWAPYAETVAPTEAYYMEDSSDTVRFTNQYGTPQTICAHSGCSRTIASTGDTNCCTVHSAECLNCGKYIDEDAVFCMDCLTKSVTKSSGNSSSGNTSSKGSSGSKCHYKEGDTEVCSNTCAPGSNFCSYHKQLLDDIYSSLTGK